jgi:hypothetical protein
MNDDNYTDWRKSSRSNGSGQCVEAACGESVVLVRDTTDRDGGTLTFSTQAWRAFTTSVRQG